MAYNLIITEKAEDLLDNLIYHLVYGLKNDQAAAQLLDRIDRIYERMEENPFHFPGSTDVNLLCMGYRSCFDRYGLCDLISGRGIFRICCGYFSSIGKLQKESLTVTGTGFPIRSGAVILLGINESKTPHFESLYFWQAGQ